MSEHSEIETMIAAAREALSAGNLQAAVEFAWQAVNLHPDDSLSLNLLGRCQLALMALPEATISFRRAAELQNPTPDVWMNLGTVLSMQGLLAESEGAFRQACDLLSGDSAPRVGLARTLMAHGRLVEALNVADEAVVINGQDPAARVVRAQLLVQLARAEEGIEEAEQAIQLEPQNHVAWSVVGAALQSLGKTEEAAPKYHRAIELNPRDTYPYYALAFSQKQGETDPALIERMERLLMDHSLAQNARERLHYGLARSYENFRNYEAAIKHYDAANRIARYIKFRGEPFDKARHQAPTDFAIAFFNEANFSRFRGIGLETCQPIFIVGMIRSGTTLMEQIVSSHSSVGAAGEQRFWNENASKAFNREGRTIDPSALRTLAAQYLEVLKTVCPGRPFVTDKMPANTLTLGLINMAFPNARMIHMRRNGADTCFSIYATPNEAKADFLHDQSSIAFAYETHLRLAEHWRQVLPKDRFMDVVYEDLVESREEVTRQVLEFCGLPWDDRCASPERNERAVATPSVWQVRQPVYRTSMQRWKNFEPWIGPFRPLANKF